jgi:soluble lytic murein transglycosylase
VAIQGMSAAVRHEPAWQYWLGRAESALGEPARAHGHWVSAAREQGFYGRLAREALSMKAPEPPVAMPSRREVDSIARLPGLVRAVALQRAGQWQDASAEWSWTVRRLDARQQAAAAAHARQLGFWNRMIDTADHMSDAHPLALRYPLPYRDLVRPAARSHGVEEALVYGVMHQESRFTPGAVSLAGARGLMQVMPATASWLAGELGWHDYQPGWLDEPGRSIVMGARYLRQLDADLGRSMVLAAAAYNAGPARALSWRGAQPIEGAVYAETIPFDETRDYVKRVMAAAVHYAELLGPAPQRLRLTERLGMVPAQRSAALETAPLLTAMAPRPKTPSAYKPP